MKIESKEQAELLLGELSRFYGEPVRPISRYCNAMRDYQRAINEREKRQREHGGVAEFNPHGEAAAINQVFGSFGKSNLLARLYAGEKLRTKMCPEHKGIWSGIEWSDSRCPHGCQLTGWIPEPGDGGPLPGVQAVKLRPGAGGKVVAVRSVDGEVLGEMKLHKPEKKPG